MPPDADEPGDAGRAFELENRIDVICDAFERQWRSGEQPELSTYLERVAAEERAALFSELLLLDWELRAQRGEYLTQEDYLRKFPEFAPQIEQIDLQRRMEETIVPIDKSTLSEPARPGIKIGHFQLEEKLGAGAAGEVWKAADMRLQRVVAIKFPRNTQLSERELLRFEREGKAAAQLQHVGIVPVHEVGRHGNLVYIVSDYIEGQDLHRWLATRRPTTRQAAELCAQLAEALHHAHERGVVHRDLKPANVILDDKGSPHITDFGLAKWDADGTAMTLEGDLLGTPAYMSPEQARGESARSDQRTDIYSLGVLLYELLTGTCPFVGDHAGVLHRVVNEPPKPPRTVDPGIPRDLETICLKAMEKRPGDRYPSAQEMAVDLRRFLRGDAIFARRASILERILRWMRKRPAVVAAGAMGVAALAAFAAMLSYAEQNRELLGFRSVLLATNPPGAEVTFIRLSDKNGEPELDKIVHASSPTPLQIDLQPGTYLTVAVLDNGRFHEVLRHVPDEAQTYPGGFAHNRWTIDDEGNVVLPDVKIPAADVHKGMAQIEGRGQSESDSNGTDSQSAIDGRIPTFYLDCTEVSVGEYRRVIPQGNVDSRWVAVSDSWAITVNYDDAVRFAEKVGKRLPTELELAYTAERGAARMATEAHAAEDEAPAAGLGPVGMPWSDRYDHTPPVFGLRSNVAEWTTSWPTVQFPAHEQPQLPVPFMSGLRIVCCGGEVALRQEGLNATGATPEVPRSVPVSRVSSGLGFRCARSVRPRTSPKDFDGAAFQRKMIFVEVKCQSARKTSQ